ncbi:MAG TPA: dimethylamine corrinoid protein 3 [Candidatus Bathyarchaeota archaeon]|nr:dimethylamine corrinoid protein 3 [Candidatus Bathyarchaeota archaeon]
MSEAEIIEGLKKAVLNYDVEAAAELAKKAVDAGIDPVKAIEEGLAAGIREVGEKFGRKEIFLPELIMAAETMNSGLKVLEPEIKKRKTERKSMGKVLIGTVAGDIHDIGKTIVAAMLTANGFEVIDLGVDVPTETFVEKVKEHQPQILALSALLTTSMPMQKEVIEALEKAGLRDKVKVIIGGAPTSREWAKEIGAEGYGANAAEAVEIAKKLAQAS